MTRVAYGAVESARWCAIGVRFRTSRTYLLKGSAMVLIRRGPLSRPFQANCGGRRPALSGRRSVLLMPPYRGGRRGAAFGTARFK